jgi:hypothetical protein
MVVHPRKSTAVVVDVLTVTPRSSDAAMAKPKQRGADENTAGNVHAPMPLLFVATV